MGSEGWIMGETLFALILLSLLLLITPLFLQVSMKEYSKQSNESTVNQLAQSLLEDWKGGGPPPPSGEKKGGDQLLLHLSVSVKPLSQGVEECELVISWEQSNGISQKRTIKGYRLVESGVANE